MKTQENMSLFRQLSPIFNVLNDENRQMIILLLAEKKVEGMSVTDITEEIELSRPTVSHHLKLLKQCGVVSFRKKGTEHIYFITLKRPVDQMKQLIFMLETHCELL
ncbi:ArsR/SmtB family transcription factor [Lysinibacillus sp. PWR01]|uniref:ArsR/SmtB family transcription factor n=1 Tax=Lysinibacillus sp. PWR01 TaxID=3342384 RepID=UPI00372D556D